MKTNKVLTLVLATCLFFVAACKDDNTDYRDSWVGTYVGDCSYHFSNGADYQYDTVFHNETLAVSKNEDNGLIVDYISICSAIGFRNSPSNVQKTVKYPLVQPIRTATILVILKGIVCFLSIAMSLKATPLYSLLAEEKNNVK